MLLIGEHDFAIFTTNPQRPVGSTAHRVYSIEKESSAAPEVEIRVAREGFHDKMVRSIAGFLIVVGTGKERPEAVAEVLASCGARPLVQGVILWAAIAGLSIAVIL